MSRQPVLHELQLPSALPGAQLPEHPIGISKEPVLDELQLPSALPGAQLPEHLVPKPQSVPEQQEFKKRLHEYTQKKSLPLPVYKSIKTGLPHAPQFISTVFVDDTSYTSSSSSTFRQRKLAEQDAAKVAWEAISQKIKEKGWPLVSETTIAPKRLEFKQRLHEYTQMLFLPLPVYQTVDVGGFPHAPQFASTVSVDGTSYTSSSTFSQRKLAEQDAARVALDAISQKIKHDGRPLVCENTTFCKAILNEYAAKMHVRKPTYNTIQPNEMLQAFVSSVDFNDVSYHGGTGRSKKEAEQLAARAAILSILDSDHAETISKIIKLKYKPYAALFRDNSSVLTTAVPVENTGDVPNVTLNKRKETDVSSDDSNMSLTRTSNTILDNSTGIQAAPGSLHEFKKPRHETPVVEIARRIVFIPSSSEHLQLPSTSGITQSRKRKKKAKTRKQINAQVPTAARPPPQITPCSVAQ